MKRSIIAVISGAVILIIAAKSIYMKSESGHKKGEPDVVGTFSINRDENITVVANREILKIEKRLQENYCRCTRMILFIRQNSQQTMDMRRALICTFIYGKRILKKESR